jgi:hypothetical protein
LKNLVTKSTAIGLVAMIVAGIGGYAIGTSHNRPRVFINRNLVHTFLEKPKKGPFRKGSDHWTKVRNKFNDYEDNDGGRFLIEEDWYVWPPKDKDGNELEHTKQVKLIYNTISNEVAIVCDKPGCPVTNP